MTSHICAADRACFGALGRVGRLRSRVVRFRPGRCAAPVSTNQINLTWSDNSDNEAGFKLDRSTSSSFSSSVTTITLSSPNATSYSCTGLSSGEVTKVR